MTFLETAGHHIPAALSIYRQTPPMPLSNAATYPQNHSQKASSPDLYWLCCLLVIPQKLKESICDVPHKEHPLIPLSVLGQTVTFYSNIYARWI